MVPKILCIGHVCHDVVEKGFVLGGTAAYCSIVASNLGYPTALLTSYGPNFLFAHSLHENHITVVNKAATATSVFHNMYEGNRRVQHLRSRAKVLHASDVPEKWLNVPIVKFCLIADELDPSLLLAFPRALKGATIQGWLRKWDEDGLISPKEMDWSLLKALDVICMSKDDLAGFEDKISLITTMVDVVVVTDGRHEAVVHTNGSQHQFPAFPVEEIDPTGAGDVFAAVFLLKYAETRDIAYASIYAHCAASLVVEGVGITRLSELDILESRINRYLELFPHYSSALDR